MTVGVASEREGTGSRAADERLCPECGGSYGDGEGAFCPKDGARLRGASRLPGDPMIGRTLAGRFRVEARLGEGAMGTVYAAQHLEMDRSVALKVMRPELMADPQMVRRFQREAQAASRIDSPHVVLLFDFGRDADGTCFMVMERLEGESLGDALRRGGPLRPLEATSVALGVARALRAAHSAGVVHRDLKPDNVFLCEDGTVKVLDFGIAKIFGDGGLVTDLSTLTGIGAVAGTPLYLSPEAARRQPVGPPADVYALGILLYQMLVGSPPFEHDAPIMILGMHIRSRHEPVSSRRPELALPESIDALLHELLAKKPEERPEIHAAIDRLERARAQLATLELAATAVMSRRELPEALIGARAGVAPPWANDVADTVPTDRPLLIDDVLAEAERRRAAVATPAGEEVVSDLEPGAPRAPGERAPGARDAGAGVLAHAKAVPERPTAPPLRRWSLLLALVGVTLLAFAGWLLLLP